MSLYRNYATRLLLNSITPIGFIMGVYTSYIMVI